MNYENFNKLASGIQSIVLALAIIIGGCWTLYTFIKLDEVKKQRAEIESIRRTLSERSVLDLNLMYSQLPGDDKYSCYLLITLEIINKGNKVDVWSWDKSKLQIAKMEIDSSRILKPSSPIEVPYEIHINDYSIETDAIGHSGNRRTFPFIVGLEDKGIYQIVFYAESSPMEQKSRQQDQDKSGGGEFTYFWYTSIYAYVN